MLNIDHCTFSYKRSGKPTIDDFSLSINEGGVYGLLGSNGAGKTTLLYLICGLLTPADGSITLDGVSTRRRLPQTMKDIFIVAEETQLPAITLKDYVRINSTFYPNFSQEDMTSHLNLFDMDADIRLDKISMGQKKKVALAFAMACNTKLLLMDEPTNGLDIPGKSSFRKFVASSMTDEKTFIISTHQVRDVGQILDHVVIVNNRRVLLDKTVSEIQEKLRFLQSEDPAIIRKALYSVSTLGGNSLVLPNDNGVDSEINYELLFEYAVSDSESLRNALS